MPHLIVRHKVQDYAQWKPVFDEHGSTRRASSSRGGQVFRSADDPHEVIVVLEWSDLESARQFVNSEDLKKAMARAGVAGQPSIYFVEEADRPVV
jgi:heme-degrading monooxygenase HmoA